MSTTEKPIVIGEASGTSASVKKHSVVYAWYVVVVLCLCQVLAALDARLPYILVEALKADMGLSDTEIGLITGPAFSLTYAIFAIPIAKLSDRGSRVAIISSAIVIWSAFTASAAFVRGAGLFALSRVGVAFGESALTPAALSLISSYHKETVRPKAIAVYYLGLAAGTFLALALGGYLSDTLGWRSVFLVVGVSGVVVAALVFFTVREPKREAAPVNRSLPKGNFKSLLGNNAIRNILLGGTLFGVSSGCLASWGPAYVMRTFHLTATETGATYGAVSGFLALAGILLGGFIASQLTKKGPHFALGALALAMLLATFTQFATLGVNDYTAFLVLTAATALLSAFYLAPTHATIQSSVDPGARSFASAVALFCINGLGIALGAFAAGAMSDLLRPIVGDQSLRAALAIATVFKLGAAFFYWRASRHLKVLAAPETAT